MTTGTLGTDESTTLTGMPKRAPSVAGLPKSGCSPTEPRWPMIATEFAATGALVIFWFHGLSDGKSWLPQKAGVIRASSSTNAGIGPRVRIGTVSGGLAEA